MVRTMKPENLVVRKMMADEVAVAVEFIRRMVEEMESMGGHAVTDDEKDWRKISVSVAEKLKDENAIYLIAENTEDPKEPVGFLEARVVTLPAIFNVEKLFHISSVYVPPQFRRTGIAELLLNKALTIGADLGCAQADLHVLTNNPAQELYKKLGFTSFQLNMRKTLSR